MIETIRADVTTLALDAIVNAANSSLLGGGGVDGAIHRAAGPRLREYNRGLGGCPVGEARVSPGFDLPARWIIHTVGPVWHDGGKGEPRLLASCYRSAFQIACDHGVGSIAFPAISTGVYGYPPELAAAIAVSAMREYLSEFDEIVACCFSSRDLDIYRKLLG